MHVRDGLTRARAGVEHEPEVAVGMLGGDGVRETDDLGEQCGIARRQLDDVAVVLRLRDHEQMHWRLRRDITDDEGVRRLGDDLSGNLTLQNPGEDRRLAHIPSLPAGLHQRPMAALTTASAAGPAVEVRSTVEPRRTISAPTAARRSSSSVAMPPSGPTTRRMSRRSAESKAVVVSAADPVGSRTRTRAEAPRATR